MIHERIYLQGYVIVIVSVPVEVVIVAKTGVYLPMVSNYDYHDYCPIINFAPLYSILKDSTVHTYCAYFNASWSVFI